MKKFCQPVTFALALMLVVTVNSYSQNAYDLPSGKILTVINQLPETLSPFFDDTVLIDSLGRLEPAFDCRVGASISNNQIQFVFMIPEYFPEEPLLDFFEQPFQPGNRRLLPVNIPERHMLQLQRWYNDAWQEMPQDLKRALNDCQISFFTIFQKEQHWLMFSGTVNSSSRGMPKVNQPIISNDPRYGEVRIWADVPGYYSTFQQAVDQGYYPLGRPIDQVTGERNPSWHVYDFFDMAPEE